MTVEKGRAQDSATGRYLNRPLRIAIAHDYLTQRGGAEKVVLALSRAFPESPIYTILYEPSATYPEFGSLDIRASPLNGVGRARRHHRATLPILPLASSLMNIDADIVIASSSGWAHGFRTNGQILVYCYSPARWLYQPAVYLGSNPSRLHRIALTLISGPLKRWDRKAAHRATRYVAISSAVRQRITDTYGIESTVVPAPQTLDCSLPTEPVMSLVSAEPFFLCVSRMLPYKNVDQVIRCFDTADRTLVVVGTGPQEAALVEMASPNVHFVKNVTDAQMRWLYANCRGLVAASYEDYGLTPLEAASFGKPSAVLRWGGFLDTVVEGVNGVFFDEPKAESIRRAVDEMSIRSWNRDAMTEHIAQFGESPFATAIAAVVDDMIRGRDGCDGGFVE